MFYLKWKLILIFLMLSEIYSWWLVVYPEFIPQHWGSFPCWSLDTWTTIIKGTSSMDVISVSMCYLFHMNDFKHNPTHQKKKLINIMSKIICILPFGTSLSSWWGPRLQNSVPWTETPRVPACIVLGRDLPIPPTIRLSFGSNRFLGDPSKRSLRRSQRRGYVDFCWENWRN